MKFTIIQALKKAFAAVMAAIMTLTGGVSGGSDTRSIEYACALG